MCLTTNNADPTQTTGVRKRLFKQIHARRREAMKEITAYINSVPFTVSAVPETFATNLRIYEYRLDESRDPYIVIREILERWYGTGSKTPPPRWFFETEIEQVVRRATTIEAERINQLATLAQAQNPYTIELLLFSDPYRERIRRVSQRVFEEMKGFTGDTANDLARTLSNYMAQGKGVATVRKAVAERFNVSMARAETIVRTELGKAHRDARNDMTKDARDRLGLDVGVQWISALAPTTRWWHAIRHTKFYTPEQVSDFYSTNANAINCLCMQQTVVRTSDGKILGARKLTQRDERLVRSIAGANKS